jgi:hypothetical protein
MEPSQCIYFDRTNARVITKSRICTTSSTSDMTSAVVLYITSCLLVCLLRDSSLQQEPWRLSVSLTATALEICLKIRLWVDGGGDGAELLLWVLCYEDEDNLRLPLKCTSTNTGNIQSSVPTINNTAWHHIDDTQVKLNGVVYEAGLWSRPSETDIHISHIVALDLPPAFTLVPCSVYWTLKMEAICSSETSLDFQRNTWR